ncbi:MAG: hypothetical protein JO308_05080, partial [Verrucomicrobia bacterium]|nr:hypothetical protein [Verrucomicrobiota bacterium]
QILVDAKADGFATACPAEKSGQDEFDFEYGEEFRAHIEKFSPTFCKVLVRYNPGSDKELNQLRKSPDCLNVSFWLEFTAVSSASRPELSRRLTAAFLISTQIDLNKGNKACNLE